MESQYIFTGRDDYPSCHAVTLAALQDGSLAAAWFAGSKESAEDSAILGSIKPAGSPSWSPPSVWVNVHQRAAGNPRLFAGPDDNLWLIAPINYGTWCQGGSRLFLKRSPDGGHSWTDLELFWEQPGILGKNKPLRTRAGTWLVPVENEVTWSPGFLRSEDQGRHWQLIMIDCRERVIQPTVAERPDGSLLSLARSWEGFVYAMESRDDGKTWTQPQPTELPNNNSGIDMVGLSSGNLVLVYNRAGLGAGTRPDGQQAWGPRSPLNIALSSDGGHTWDHDRELEQGPATSDYAASLTNIAVPSAHEYSYPAVIARDGLIHAAYTHHRTAIKHVALTEAELQSSPAGPLE